MIWHWTTVERGRKNDDDNLHNFLSCTIWFKILKIKTKLFSNRLSFFRFIQKKMQLANCVVCLVLFIFYRFLGWREIYKEYLTFLRMFTNFEATTNFSQKTYFCFYFLFFLKQVIFEYMSLNRLYWNIKSLLFFDFVYSYKVILAKIKIKFVLYFAFLSLKLSLVSLFLTFPE